MEHNREPGNNLIDLVNWFQLGAKNAESRMITPKIVLGKLNTQIENNEIRPLSTTCGKMNSTWKKI
jgi:hypothetical protein